MDSPATVETGSAPSPASHKSPAAQILAGHTGERRRRVALRAANGVLGFVLEVAMLAGFVYWSLAQNGPWDLVCAIGIPAVTVVLWGVFLAPHSERRLSAKVVRWSALVLFLAAAAALAVTGAVAFAALLAAFAAVHFAVAWFTER